MKDYKHLHCVFQEEYLQYVVPSFHGWLFVFVIRSNPYYFHMHALERKRAKQILVMKYQSDNIGGWGYGGRENSKEISKPYSAIY